MKRYIFNIIVSFFTVYSFGQTPIEILSAQELIYNQTQGDYQLCKGNVKFKQGTVFMDCDSAKFYDKENKIEAFGSIRILQRDTLDLRGEFLTYDGDNRLATISKNVTLSDGKMILSTESLLYNLIDKKGNYSSGGHIVNGDDNLYSRRGTYLSRTKDLFFRDTVRLINPDYTMESDTLQYNILSKTATFLGPTYIFSDENTIFCNYGWYNTQTETSQFSQGAYIESNNSRLDADSMVYFRISGLGEAFGDIQFEDSVEKISIFGQYASYQRLSNKTLISGEPMAIKKMSGDTLFLKADTFIDYIDSMQHRLLSAFSNVRLYKSDIQSYSDSLCYNFSDSSIGFYEKPILWSGNNQLTGDTIFIFTNDSVVEFMDIRGSAFTIEEDINGLYNQVSGRHMKVYFKAGELKTIDVQGNAQSIYFALEDSTQYTGVNDVYCGDMRISMNKKNVRTIKFMTQPKSIFYPLEKFPKTKYRIPGFKWEIDLKPKKPNFIN